MPFFKFTTNKVVKRLRWFMMGVILFDNINTLFGQSATYWQHPETAQEGNRLTHFFISRGWLSFCLYELADMAVAFLLASLAPRRLALVVILAFIFGHYYGASTWLADRWHLGTQGTVIYAIMLAVIFVLFAFPPKAESDPRKLKDSV
jgi:hypothetical protein